MIILKIGNEERRNGDIDERWMAQQFRKRKVAGIPFCTRVIINQGTVNISLSAGDCLGGGIAGRPPKREERELIDLWD